ncbi:MAG: carbohydrate-binding family 9-like protein [Bacteroidales bacterium]|nr:carbohydrate-binding family 9-like protein [Bacteroidales bacterium]
MLFSVFSCSGPGGNAGDIASQMPPKPEPKGYVCYRRASPVNPDGILSEPEWGAAQWTDYFADIEGQMKPDPPLKTRVKLLWDDDYLYVAAELEEPHIQASLRQRDTVIFYDNDFEVFIDPDGDTHAYFELEINAFGTPWDLLLLKPYRDGGPPVDYWDIAGLRTGIFTDGTINNPRDTDQGWTAEIMIPMAALREGNRGGTLPVAGDSWRINFSRVEWRMVVRNGRYEKEVNPQTGKPYPENNWVWSPQGRINMHMPEMWGYLQFSGAEAGTIHEQFVPDSDQDVKWALRMIYYAENEYFKKNGFYTPVLKNTGLSTEDLPEGLPVPVTEATTTTFESYFPNLHGKQGWTIYYDGRIVNLNESKSDR